MPGARLRLEELMDIAGASGEARATNFSTRAHYVRGVGPFKRLTEKEQAQAPESLIDNTLASRDPPRRSAPVESPRSETGPRQGVVVERPSTHSPPPEDAR